MFVVEAVHEMPIVSQLTGETGKRYFSAAALSTVLPWYLVTLVFKDDHARLLHTVLCAWEDDLLPLLKQTPDREPAAVQQLALETAGGIKWTTRDIRRVWISQIAPNQWHTVLEDAQGMVFSGPFGGASTDDPKLRKLIFEAHPAPRRGGQRKPEASRGL